jgi:hypothetical protein
MVLKTKKVIPYSFFFISFCGFLFSGNEAKASGLFTMKHIEEALQHSSNISRVPKDTFYQLSDRRWFLSAPMESRGLSVLSLGPQPRESFKNSPGNKMLQTSIMLTGIIKGALFTYDIMNNSNSEALLILTATPLIYGPPFLYAAGTGLLARNIFDPIEVRPQDSRMYLYGNLMGVWHGDILSRTFQTSSFEEPGGWKASFMALSMMAEGWLSYGLSKWMKFNDHQVRGWSYGNFWGTFLGRDVTLAIDGRSQNYERILPFYQLGSAAAGALLGSYFNKKHPRSKGQSMVINTLGGLGYLLQRGLADRYTHERSGGLTGVLVTAGLLTGAHYFTGRMNIDDATGFYFLTGAALGGGITYLFFNTIAFEPSQIQSKRNLLVAGGAIVGAVGFLAVKNAAKALRFIVLSGEKTRNMTLDINPAGIAVATFSENYQASLMQMNTFPEIVKVTMPLRKISSKN